MSPSTFLVQVKISPFTFMVLIDDCPVPNIYSADISGRNLAHEEVVGVPLQKQRSIYFRGTNQDASNHFRGTR